MEKQAMCLPSRNSLLNGNSETQNNNNLSLIIPHAQAQYWAQSSFQSSIAV